VVEDSEEVEEEVVVAAEDVAAVAPVAVVAIEIEGVIVGKRSKRSSIPGLRSNRTVSIGTSTADGPPERLGPKVGPESDPCSAAVLQRLLRFLNPRALWALSHPVPVAA
jgi:hypothetical protein